MIRTFKHKILTFTPSGVLAQCGMTPVTGALYYSLFAEVSAIIESQVLVTAEKLNKILKETYQKDMSLIPEYSKFPAYFAVLKAALSHPRNTGVYWDNKGLIQAKFVDIDGLGDTNDLQRIQKAVHSGGTLMGWIGIYNAWLAGESKKYEEIVNARLAIMRAETSAPFWEVLELGNGDYAYPRNGPTRTLLTFKATYNREMKATYARILATVRSLAMRPSKLFVDYQFSTITYNNRMFSGHSWVARGGDTIFAISGTTTIDNLGYLRGKGFRLDAAGIVVKRWSGWLPR